MTLNFSCICRLCLAQKDELVPLFNEDNSLPARIMTFAPVIKMYAGDSLPSQVCPQCIQQVNSSYNFKLQCESSDIALRQYLRNLNPEVEPTYQENVESKMFAETTYDDSDEDCRDDFSDVKIEVKDGFGSEEASRLQSMPAQEHAQPSSSFYRNTVVLEASDKTDHNVCCSHVCGKDCAQSEARKKSNSSQVNGTSEKKHVPRNLKNSSLSETVKKRKGPRKKTVEEPIVKIEEGDMKDDDFFDRFSNVDDDDLIEALPMIQEKERFVCNECGNVFAQKSGLLKHLRTHTGEKPFCCSMCGKTFRQSGNLTLHIRTHTGEKPFSCTECGESFGQSSTLTRHMRTHTGEKPFCCQVCGKSFGLRNTLTLHERSHMDDKPFHCTMCGKRFLRSSNLNEHMRIHTGEKPFTCAECGKSFVRRCDHKIHMRMHSGEKQFVCTECGKRFLRSTELKIHMRLHTGEKPYSCQDCGKRFIRSNQLKRHKKTHMIIKPF